jgi:hypothetical protein
VGERDRPYAAYCDYPGRRLLLNLDFAYTRGLLKHLACHEAFPGHLVHLARRAALVAAGEMPLEGAQVVTNSASSALFEGIADNGEALLDWIDGPEDHASLALNRLRSALRCNAAWMVHGEGKGLDETVAEIASASFQDAATTRRRLAFLSHPLRAPFVYAYWCGDDAVRSYIARAADLPRRDGKLGSIAHRVTNNCAPVGKKACVEPMVRKGGLLTFAAIASLTGPCLGSGHSDCRPM